MNNSALNYSALIWFCSQTLTSASPGLTNRTGPLVLTMQANSWIWHPKPWKSILMVSGIGTIVGIEDARVIQQCTNNGSSPGGQIRQLWAQNATMDRIFGPTSNSLLSPHKHRKCFPPLVADFSAFLPCSYYSPPFSAFDDKLKPSVHCKPF